MTLYQNFIGIDIGKFNFVVSVHENKKTTEYENNNEGIDNFIKDHKALLTNSLFILEPTGGHETALLLTLCDDGFHVHRANSRKVKNFICSLGNGAKTDNLDAKALALYGFERASRLNLFKPQSITMVNLGELIGRRNDLKQILVAEKNRLKSPKNILITSSYRTMIAIITEEIKSISDKINAKIAEDKTMSARKKIIKAIPGIGDITANELLTILPELGTLDRRKIASLAGLAPRSNDSGKFSGYRSIAHGRGSVKPVLFLAAMQQEDLTLNLKRFMKN